MLAPKQPEGLEEAVGKPMHEFLKRQLETMLEDNSAEARDVAQTFFARGMERLYKRGVDQKYTTYYEEMMQVVIHGRKFMDSEAGKRMKYDADSR